MNFLLVLILLISISYYGATCHTGSNMSEVHQKMINETLGNRRYFLKSSFYYGDFYGNSDVCLLSPRRFSDTIYLEDIDGKPIVSGKEKGIVPFNTEVKVEKIEFPLATRPLLTPRFYPWVYVTVDRPLGYKACIVVIKPDVAKPEDFKKLFDEIFSENSFESYLKSVSSDVRDAIYEKKFKEDLSEEEIRIIFGKPDSVTFYREGDINIKALNYPSFKIILKNGKSYKLEEVGNKR
ncbi:MAG: hypothetical protein N2746_03220 [Deltaproteobacteria bacterium]|nr:hypothetical protein [Deltaproteobacteria bacterium]